MSIRKLPELIIPAAPGEVAFDVAPQALAAWDASVVAAVGEEGAGTIAILTEIGENWDGTGITSKSIEETLRKIGPKPVDVLINSPGGNFFDGLAIYNLLRNHPAEVTVKVLGIAASAAAVIAMSGDTVQIAKAGLMMIHNTQWIAIGDRHVMLETHNTMEVFDQAAVDLFADRSGLKVEEVGGMMDATTFMSGTTAIDKGFADELLPADQVKKATNKAPDKPVGYKLEAALAKMGMPRGERRKLLKELTGGKPGAATESGMPRAAEPAVEDGDPGLSVALARLKLMRA